MLPLHVLDHPLIESLETDRPVAEDLGHLVAAASQVGVAEGNHHARRRAVDQADGRLQHGGAGALGADQRTCDVKSMLWQERRRGCSRRRGAGYPESGSESDPHTGRAGL